MQFSRQAASPETFGYTLVQLWNPIPNEPTPQKLLHKVTTEPYSEPFQPTLHLCNVYLIFILTIPFHLQLGLLYYFAALYTVSLLSYRGI